VIQIKCDIEKIKGVFTDALERQIPFALSLAINNLAKDVIGAGDTSIGQNFVVRKAWVQDAFWMSSVSDKHQDPIKATISMKKDHALLNKFEEGGSKAARSYDEPIAIPTAAIRPGFAGSVPLELYPKNLRLMPRRTASGTLGAKGRVMRNGMAQLQGNLRTFVIDPATMPGASKWGVWQRFGPGKHDIRRIWTYKKSIPIPRRLHFAETAQRTAEALWERRFEEAWTRAVETAR